MVHIKKKSLKKETSLPDDSYGWSLRFENPCCVVATVGLADEQPAPSLGALQFPDSLHSCCLTDDGSRVEFNTYEVTSGSLEVWND